jgi:Caspase domain
VRQFLRIFVAFVLTHGAAAGVIPWTERQAEPGPIVPEDSAALFVGVREFAYDETLAEVRYAVDDAVDLAYVLSIDIGSRLVDPKRVILALSGDPQKPQSQRRLDTLIGAGATVKSAGQSDVLMHLEHQARLVGKDGLLVVAFATHGVSDEGIQYLLTASSLLQHRETSISESKVRDIVVRSRVPRSLILVDACREILTTHTRAGEADPQSAAALMRALANTHGQVVFSAAAAGGYAYDDDARRNGVFTAAVIDGLHCEAPADPRGLITVDTLATFVEDRVLTWIRQRDPTVTHATQLHCVGATKSMPLAACARRKNLGQ